MKYMLILTALFFFGCAKDSSESKILDPVAEPEWCSQPNIQCFQDGTCINYCSDDEFLKCMIIDDKVYGILGNVFETYLQNCRTYKSKPQEMCYASLIMKYPDLFYWCESAI